MTDRDDIRAPEGAIPAGGEATTIHNAALEPIKAHRSLWKDVWIQFRSHKGAVVGTFVFLFIVLGTIFGPFFHTTDPTYIDYRAKNSQHMFSCFFFSVPETVEDASAWTTRNCLSDPEGFTETTGKLIKVSWAHPLGTDNYGRDVLAQLMAGGQVSLAVGVTAMGLSIVLGALIGVMAGFFRWMDGPLMRLTDLFLALPILPLLLVMIMLFRDTLRASFGPETGIFILVVTAIGITSWMQTARIVPRRCSVDQGTRVRAGRAIDRHAPAPDHRSSHFPERAVADHGVGDAGTGDGDHHRIGTVVPGPRLSVRLPNLGTPADRRSRLHGHHPQPRDLAGARHLADRAVRQLHRRRPARRVGPPAEDLTGACPVSTRNRAPGRRGRRRLHP